MMPEEAKLTIEYLKEIQEKYIEGEGYERHPLPEWYALDKAIEVIEQTTWTPCNKGLPKEAGDYLTTTSFDIGANEPVREVYKNFFCNLSQTWLNHDEDVVAWMSLPASYETENER